MQKLLVLQSLWAMEGEGATGTEPALEEKLARIIAAGYDGVSTHCTDRATVRRVMSVLGPHGLVMEGQCFPTTADGIKPALEIAAAYGVRHLDVQPDVRPRRVADCIPLLDAWRRDGERAGFPVWFETHRDRMTTDLFFTLDLLDCFPDLPLIADLAHYLVGREFAWPVPAEAHAQIHRILDHSWGLHGRVGSREQAQVSLSFAQNAIWRDLFLDWWEYGMRSWRARAAADATLTFTCELGPPPYAITGADGRELSDRWAEALLLRDLVRERWERSGASRKDPGPARARRGLRSRAPVV